MNKRIKGKWLNWLRSGQYRQTKGNLCSETRSGNNSFCCHGVLCNIYAEETGGHWEGDGKTVLSYKNKWTMPPSIVTQWAGLKTGIVNDLANMNDNGDSFKKIADFIEKNL